MVTAPFVYLSIFSFTNLLISLYLQNSVKKYKTEGKLPVWVVRTRNILDHLDDSVKTLNSDEIRNLNSEKLSDFNFFHQKLVGTDQLASLSFLQIKPFQEGGDLYDFRDDYEFKMSKKPLIDLNEKYDGNFDEETIKEMNKSREDEIKGFNDLAQVEEELYDNERADLTENEYRNDHSEEFHHLAEVLKEFENEIR